jgi:hypothetical protein
MQAVGSEIFGFVMGSAFYGVICEMSFQRPFKPMVVGSIPTALPYGGGSAAETPIYRDADIYDGAGGGKADVRLSLGR